MDISDIDKYMSNQSLPSKESETSVIGHGCNAYISPHLVTECTAFSITNKEISTVEKGSKDEPDVSSKDDPFLRYRLSKQLCLVFIYICMGMSGEMSGPTLPDLKDRIGVNYEEISRALVGKSVGMMIGSVVGGFLHEKYYGHTDLILAVTLALMACGCFILPWSTSVAMASCAFAINGISDGLINTGGNTMVMDLWQERAASPMHSLHFGFGFGALLAPQIARPFLSPDDNSSDINSLSKSFPQYVFVDKQDGTSEPNNTEDLSRIEIPYSIVGSFILVFSFVVLGFYLKGRPKGFPVRVNKTRFKDMISPGSCANNNKIFGAVLLICLFFYFVQAVGGERAYGKFLFSFAIESDVNMTKDDASILQTAFWLSFTTGRLLGIPLAKWIPLNAIIVANIIGNIVTASVLSIYAYDVAVILWIFTCLMGFFIAIVFPNGMSWANLHLQMNSVAVMVLMVGGSCGGILYQYLAGYLFEYEGPQSLMSVMVGYSIVLMLSYIAMMLVARLCKLELDIDDTLDVKGTDEMQIEHVHEMTEQTRF